MAAFKFPVSILFLSFTLKLFVDNRVKVPNFMEAITFLPIDIIILALTYISSYLIITKNTDLVLSLIFWYIAFVVLTIFFSKRSNDMFDLEKYKLMFVYLFFAYSISIPSLFYSISIMVGVKNV